MSDTPSLAPATERALQLPFATLAGAVLLHADRLPLWCSITTLSALAWRRAVSRGLCGLPPKWLRGGLTLLLVLLSAGLFRSLGGLAAASALLTTMGALKLLETRSARDGRILVGAAIFLLVAACLDRQGLPRLPLYAASIWLSCAALFALGSPATGASPRRALQASARSLALALPFAVLCFLLFPRLATPLWGSPGSGRATSGMSDELSPGSIVELALSEEIAFRVRFDGPAPAPRLRYWRGPVLHDFDGFTWRRASLPQRAPEPLGDQGEAVRYDITLEPTRGNLWLALDTPESIEAPQGQRAMLGADRQVQAFRPVMQTVTYHATSRIDAQDNTPLPDAIRRQDLRLPADRNPRSLAFAQALRAANPDDAAFIRALLDHFRTQGYRYTLTPPPLQQDAVDDFLFRTREGFCGHFASAFAALLRAGGVPARVVAGYLGGDWNAYGGYYSVSQSAAHAWTEAYVEGRGWVRIDPTAVVQPGRLENRLHDLLPDASGMGSLRNAVWVRQLLETWDAGNQWWQRRVVGFNSATQRSLLEQFGLPDADYRTLVLLLATGAGLWLGVLAWRTRRVSVARGDALARAWDAMRSALARRGLEGVMTAGPRDLAARAGHALPELAPELGAIAAEYETLRYGPAAPGAPDDAARREDAVALIRRIRRLLPRLRRGGRILHAQQQQATGDEQHGHRHDGPAR